MSRNLEAAFALRARTRAVYRVQGESRHAQKKKCVNFALEVGGSPPRVLAEGRVDFLGWEKF